MKIDNDESSSVDSPKLNPINDLEELITIYTHLEEGYQELASYWGGERATANALIPWWRQIMELDGQGQSDSDYIQSAKEILHDTRLEMEKVYLTSGMILPPLESSTGGTVTTTASTISILLEGIPLPGFELLQVPKRPPKIVLERLKKLDPELEAMFGNIIETYYGNPDVAIRHSLFDLRQIFDHFFSIIAPNDAVKDSIYYEPRKPRERRRVKRPERILFAANTHITDPIKRKKLLDQAKHTLDLYKKLNSLYKRGRLSKRTHSTTIFEMIQVINDWVLALDDEMFI